MPEIHDIRIAVEKTGHDKESDPPQSTRGGSQTVTSAWSILSAL